MGHPAFLPAPTRRPSEGVTPAPTRVRRGGAACCSVPLASRECRRFSRSPTSSPPSARSTPSGWRKQRVEVIQVVRALTVPGYGSANHPATLMWRGFEEALGRYGLACCEVWLELGFGDTCAATIVADLRTADVTTVRDQAELAVADALPPWLGDEDLHRSHRSALSARTRTSTAPVSPTSRTTSPTSGPSAPPRVLEAERRRAESAVRREQRAAERLLAEAERARRREPGLEEGGRPARPRRADVRAARAGPAPTLAGCASSRSSRPRPRSSSRSAPATTWSV